jgi:hypothetical protein
MARWLSLLGEFDRRDGWWTSGCKSMADWVSWRCALSPRAAREQVRVARALRELPLIREAFESGRLSYSKVRVLTRVAEPHSEGDLLQLARHATAAQLERILRAFRRVSRDEAQAAYENRYLDHYWDEDGSLCLRARLPAEEGALVLQALDQSRDALFRARDDSERGPGGRKARTAPRGRRAARSRSPARAPPPDQRRRHLRDGRDGARARPDSAARPGAPPAHRRRRPGLPGAVHVRDGPALAPETARRLGCDASVIGIRSSGGETLSVGRRTRSIPPQIRRALDSRDKGCRFPGCENRRWVDAHHIHHWAHGGETRLDNLVVLCRHHHRLVHEGGFSVRRTPPGELEFRRPDGDLIEAAPPLPFQRAAPAPATRAGPLQSGTGERMDFPLCVDAVFAATDRGG